MIEVERVTKRYGRARGVEDVTFSVAKGEVIGFLGPNGAGKTTTMRIITGFMPPTSGTVRVAGYDILDEPVQARRQIGYLPETPPLYSDMSVRGYLEFAAEIRGVPAAQRRRRVDEAIERLALGDVQRRLIQNLSKGYKQRVGLAQALVHDPQVLVLDEPSSGLDPKQIIEIRQLIRGLAEDHTVILSSHILPEVSAICGRVIIVHEGRVVAVDTPDGLARRLAGGAAWFARVKGAPDRVRACVAAVPGVREVELGRDLGGAVELTLHGEANPPDGGEPAGDVRERLFYALAAAGLPLLELRPLDLSLEQVFLRLTTTEGPGAEAAERVSADA